MFSEIHRLLVGNYIPTWLCSAVLGPCAFRVSEYNWNLINLILERFVETNKALTPENEYQSRRLTPEAARMSDFKLLNGWCLNILNIVSPLNSKLLEEEVEAWKSAQYRVKKIPHK